jgi:hypothetical protein
MSQGYAPDEARRWVRRKRVFYLILLTYAALSLMWFAIDALTGADTRWFYWPALGVGIGVAIYGIVILGASSVFGARWERRQVDRYVERRGEEGNG